MRDRGADPPGSSLASWHSAWFVAVGLLLRLAGPWTP